MALRCSLFGHAFDDGSVERTRTEQGERVVVTVREVRTCGRCGETEVVGERTEVTAAGDADGAGGGQADADWEDAEWGTAGETAPGGVPDGTAGAEATAGPDASTPPGAATDPETDDGVILEGGPDGAGGGGPGGRGRDGGRDDGGRAHGEWPQRERRGREGDGDGPRPWPEPPQSSGDAPDLQQGGWPEPGGEDEGFDAEPTSGGGVDLGGGLAPEGAGDAGDGGLDDVEVVDDAEIVDPSAGTGGGSPPPAPTDRRDLPPDRETEFVCPECGFAEHSTVASVRPGDVCPECRSGYLEERPTDG